MTLQNSIVEKARKLCSDKEYTRGMLLMKTAAQRSPVVFHEYANAHMQMEIHTLGHTTFKSIKLFKDARYASPCKNEQERIEYEKRYNMCKSHLREEDKIEELPLVESFSDIYPKTLVPFIQKECKILNKTAVNLPDGKRATYWFDLQKKPRFALEEIVKRIYELDFPNDSGKKHGIVGCEWWSQVRRPGEDIVFHFDKDEGMASNKKIFQFPYIGTVTYLTECGGPTMVFDHRTNSRNNSYTPRKPTNGFISMPAIGKHIKFDGELFHGVMGAMNFVTKEPARITFLINYWLYKPEEPNCTDFPFPERMAKFTESQRSEFLNHVQDLPKDEIHPLPREGPSRIIPIIRGSQSFYISFPQTIERDKTYSFETTHEIPYGFLSVSKTANREMTVSLKHFTYSKPWYWTVTIDKKNPIVMKQSETTKKIKCKRGKHRVTVRAFTMQNVEIAHQQTRISV